MRTEYGSNLVDWNGLIVTTNSTINTVSQMIPAASILAITSITNQGRYCIVTTAAPYPYFDKESVLISGAADPNFNGYQRITFIDSTHFSYMASALPTGAYTGATVASLKVTKAIVYADPGNSANVTIGPDSNASQRPIAPGQEYTIPQTVSPDGNVVKFELAKWYTTSGAASQTLRILTICAMIMLFFLSNSAFAQYSPTNGTGGGGTNGIASNGGTGTSNTFISPTLTNPKFGTGASVISLYDAMTNYLGGFTNGQFIGNGRGLTNILGTVFDFSRGGVSANMYTVPFTNTPAFENQVGTSRNGGPAACLWWNGDGTSNGWSGSWLIPGYMIQGDAQFQQYQSGGYHDRYFFVNGNGGNVGSSFSGNDSVHVEINMNSYGSMSGNAGGRVTTNGSQYNAGVTGAAFVVTSNATPAETNYLTDPLAYAWGYVPAQAPISDLPDTALHVLNQNWYNWAVGVNSGGGFSGVYPFIYWDSTNRVLELAQTWASGVRRPWDAGFQHGVAIYNQTAGMYVRGNTTNGGSITASNGFIGTATAATNGVNLLDYIIAGDNIAGVTNSIPLQEGQLLNAFNGQTAALWWNKGKTTNGWMGNFTIPGQLTIGDPARMPFNAPNQSTTFWYFDGNPTNQTQANGTNNDGGLLIANMNPWISASAIGFQAATTNAAGNGTAISTNADGVPIYFNTGQQFSVGMVPPQAPAAGFPANAMMIVNGTYPITTAYIGGSPNHVVPVFYWNPTNQILHLAQPTTSVGQDFEGGFISGVNIYANGGNMSVPGNLTNKGVLITGSKPVQLTKATGSLNLSGAIDPNDTLSVTNLVLTSASGVYGFQLGNWFLNYAHGGDLDFAESGTGGEVLRMSSPAVGGPLMEWQVDGTIQWATAGRGLVQAGYGQFKTNQVSYGFVTNSLSAGSITTGGMVATNGYIEQTVTKTSSYTLTASDSVVYLNGATLTATLPTAVGASGKRYTIKLIASSTGTVNTTSSQNIEGSTSVSLAKQYDAITVQSDGTQWWIINEYSSGLL